MRCSDAATSPTGAAPATRAAARAEPATEPAPGVSPETAGAAARAPAGAACGPPAASGRSAACGPPAASGPPVPLAPASRGAVRSAVREADRRVLDAFRAYGQAPGAGAAVRGLGRAGEHAGVWLAAGVGAACLDAGRRDAWLRASALVAGAHAGSMVLKRFVRRPRPRLDAGPTAAPLVRTTGRHGFPSSHAASSAAAAVAFTALEPRLPFRPLAVAVCLSRLVAGVHYPSDVVFGVLLGAVTARVGRPWALPGRTAGAGGDRG